MRPTVSVVLPAYNADRWLAKAIDSILLQSLRDLELILIDDGSTDGTLDVLARYNDRRLIIVRNATNEGLVAALNQGIELARGRYIARMDADDISYRARLELQVRFLETRSDVGICGTWFRLMGGRWPTTLRTPTEHDDISAQLFFRSPFGHPTIVFRTEFLRQTDMRYDPASADAEDFDLWVRARAKTHFANMPRVLMSYRLHGEQTSVRSKTSQSRTAVRIRLQQLAELVPSATDAERDLHLRISAPDVFSTKDELLRARDWLYFLDEANRKGHLFSRNSFAKALAHTWTYCCLATSMAPRHVVPIYLSTRLGALKSTALRSELWTVAKLLLRPIAG